MRNTTKKLLVLIAVVAVMVAALVVSTSAYIAWDGAAFTGGTASGYADINTAEWVQISGSANVDAGGDGKFDGAGDLLKGSGYRTYFNETKGILVIEGGGNITAGSGDKNDAKLFPNWAKVNSAKVKELQIRDVTSLNNLAYIIGQLKSVEVVKISTTLTETGGTKSDTAPFVGLTAMDTLLWGDWDKATGEFKLVLGEEDVVTIGGVVGEGDEKKTVGLTKLNIAATTYNGSHSILYNGSFVSGTAVKKLVLPTAQTLGNPNLELGKLAVSDGTFVDGNSKSPSYNQIIASGKLCTVLENKNDGSTGYTTHWDVDGATWKKVVYKAADTEPFFGDYSGVIGYMYAKNCAALETVIVPETVTLKLIEGEAFSGCTSLRCITVNGKIDPALVIEANAFKGVADGCIIQCANDADIAVLNGILEAAGVTNVKAVDKNTQPTPPPKFTVLPAAPDWTAPDLTGATASGEVKNTYTDNVWAYYADTKTLKIFAAKDKGYNETGSISEQYPAWSAYLTEIEHVVLGPAITKLGNTAFKGMTALKDVCITADVTQAQNPFGGCTSLTTIWVDGMERVEGLAVLAGAKENYAIDLSDTKIKAINWGSSPAPFIGKITPSITTEKLYFDTPTAEIIAYCEANLFDLEDQNGKVFGEWYVEFDTTLPKCGKTAVYSFDAATGTLTVTGKGAISDNFKWSCDKKDIKNVVLGKYITVIGKEAFAGCQNLSSVTVEGKAAIEGAMDLTYVTKVEGKAFAENYLIANVIVGEKAEKIDATAFDKCVNIKTIYGVPGSAAETYAKSANLAFLDSSKNTPAPIKCEPPKEEPKDTTTAPKDTTTASKDTTTAPKDTTTAPKDTTTAPKDTTTAPKDTTTAPKDTTTAPKDTTATPKDTTAAPNDDTNAPETKPVAGTDDNAADDGATLDILPIIIIAASVVVVAIAVVVVIILKKKGVVGKK